MCMRLCARWCGCWSHTSACWNGIPQAARIRAAAPTCSPRFRSMWIAPVIACRRGCLSRDVTAGGVGRGGADPASLVCRPRHRLVDQPAAGWTQRGARRPMRRCFCGRCREGPGHSSRPSLARKTTGCRRTTIRSIRLPRSRTARHRPTWGWRCWRICPRTTSATSRPGQLVERTANALRTMETLERHRGHFYNWYDTQSLKPLAPLYISTVDSGNLAGHLLTLAPGLLCAPR